MIPALARDNRIERIYPGSSLAAVQAVGNLRGLTAVEVPDDTQVGATLIDDVWTNPAPQEVVVPPIQPRLISIIEYKLRLTPVERCGIREAAKTNPFVYDFQDLLDSVQEVDLNLPTTREALMFLTTVNNPIAGLPANTKLIANAARVEEILS